MASYVSPELISAMGFEDTLVPERLIATFSGFTVFEVRGITITDELSRSVTGIAAGVNYRIGVSASVNSACRAIADDDFVDAEIEWMKEHQAQGPFALVQIGPTEAYEAEVTHIRRGADGSITTYDAFASSREEIRRLEHRALPRIAAALACAFNEQDRYVRLKKVARTTVGELQDGTTLHDVRLEFRGELSTSYAIGQRGPSGQVGNDYIACAVLERSGCEISRSRPKRGGPDEEVSLLLSGTRDRNSCHLRTS